MKNILTFDIEEWFHILDYGGPNYKNTWDSKESRVHIGLEHIFDVLEKTNSRATFFIVGWVAKKYPNIVKEIAERNYHIGSHSNMHQLAYNQTKEEFEKDLRSSLEILNTILSKNVDSFRAPGFSIKSENLHYIDILIDNGIKIDCSIFPANRSHGGIPEFPYSEPCVIKNSAGKEILELPMSKAKPFNLMPQSIYTGGGYFRLFPEKLILKAIKKSDYNMLYFHPRDFDLLQPKLENLGPIKKFKTYVGISTCKSKLQSILSYENCVDIPTFTRSLDKSGLPKYQIS